MWRRVAILAVLGAIGAAIWRWLTGYQLLEQGASYTIRELRPLHRYPTYAQDVNNNGQVVGYAIIGDNEHETAGFVWDEDAGFQTLWTGWVVQDHWTQAVAINDNGQVVGHCLLGGKAHACIWDLSDGTFEIVHSLLEESCRAVDINNDGQVVGYIGDGFETNPFLWDAIGGVQALEPLASDGPFYSRPFAINETGEAVGHWFVPPNGSDHLIGFRWSAMSFLVDIGNMGGRYTTPTGISNTGYIVGNDTGPLVGERAFRWTETGGFENLGTLSGDRSEAWGVDDHGRVVGTSTNAAGEPRAFLADPTSPTLEMTELGTLGGNTSEARAINGGAQVVGFSMTADGETHAFLWDESTGMRDLGAWSSGGKAHDINDAGQVVGVTGSRDAGRQAFLWTETDLILDLGNPADTQSYAAAIGNAGHVAGYIEPVGVGLRRPFVWDPDSGFRELGTLGGERGEARDVNGLGLVAGYSTLASGDSRAFLWDESDEPNPMSDLGVVGAMGEFPWLIKSSAVKALNDAGQVVGITTTADGEQAFLWDRESGMRALGGGEVNAMSNSGQMVGRFYTAGGYWHACLWEEANEESIRDLGTLGGNTSKAYAINEVKQVVGIAQTADGLWHAFVWDEVELMRDLGTLGGDSSCAYGINAAGVIAGYSTTIHGGPRPVLWIPPS